MLFKNRIEAGQKLGAALKKYERANKTIVLGLPRGGVVVAFEVAIALQLPLDVIVPRKLGAPENPELAIGAIAQDAVILDERIIEAIGVLPSYIDAAIAKEKKEAERRMSLFRKGKAAQDFAGLNTIVVDDGVATGSTMRASIAALRKMHVAKIIVAIPVAPSDTLNELKAEVDEVICLYSPASFMAVGQFYETFPQTTDDEVIQLLKKGAWK